MTYTFTETIEERWLRMIREAISQGDKVPGSHDSDAAMADLHAAERHAEEDITNKTQIGG